jgi:hypothetical protein
MILCEFMPEHTPIYVGLAYLAVFHTIKQQYGFFRIYSRFDGKKKNIESLCESTLIYCSMVTPVLYWHVYNTDPHGVWFNEFLMHKNWIWAFYVSALLYSGAFVGYLFFESKRTREKNHFCIPKNLCLLLTMLSWGIVSFLPKNALVLAFAVQLHHNVSYISVVWLMGRRDRKALNGKIELLSVFSIPGLALYAPFVIVFGQVLFTIFRELCFDLNKSYFLLGTSLNWIPKAQGWWGNLGWGVFFAVQIHHFITDRFLWKKEKDTLYLISQKKGGNESSEELRKVS